MIVNHDPLLMIVNIIVNKIFFQKRLFFSKEIVFKKQAYKKLLQIVLKKQLFCPKDETIILKNDWKMKQKTII